MRGILASLLAALVFAQPILATAAPVGPTRAAVQPQIIASWGPLGVAIAQMHAGGLALASVRANSFAAPVILAGFTAGGGGAGGVAVGDSPTWTGEHTFSGEVTLNGGIDTAAGNTYPFRTDGILFGTLKDLGSDATERIGSLGALSPDGTDEASLAWDVRNGIVEWTLAAYENGAVKGYIRGDDGFGLQYDVGTGLTHLFYVNSIQEAQITAAGLAITDAITAGGEVAGGFGTGNPALVYAGGTLFASSTAVGNVGASGPDELISYTLPANSLAANNRGFHWKAWGTVAASANAKTLTCNYGGFGGQVVLTHVMVVSVGGTWNAEGTVIRTGVDTQDWSSVFEGNLGAAGVYIHDPEIGTGTKDDGATMPIFCQTTVSTDNNDIVQEGMWVRAF